MERPSWWSRDRGTLWVRELPGNASSLVVPGCDVAFAELDCGTREQRPWVANDLDAEWAQARLRAGRRCFVAVSDGVVVSYAWVSRDCERVGELERVFVLPARDRYIWDCATLPAYRGQHLYTALLTHVLATLKNEGVVRAWIGASRANGPSIRGIVRAGFVPAVSTRYARLWRLRYLSVSREPAAPPGVLADAIRMLAQQHERRIGRMLFGLGEPAGQPCGAV